MIGANISRKTRYEVYRRDGFQCALCGYHGGLQIHHAIPRIEGGSSKPENLITLCNVCHMTVHGDMRFTYPTAEDVSQACVEYLADYYTTVEGGETRVWNPWIKELEAEY